MTARRNFSSVVNPNLLTENVTNKIIEFVKIPGLHLALGIVDKLLTEKLFESTEEEFQFVNDYLIQST